MTDRNEVANHKKLIEEARQAIAREWRNVRSHEDMARAALAVFEKAHTPTDDEREAPTDEALRDFGNDLLDAWNIEDTNSPSLIEDFRDRFVARFRRSEVPEPSAEGPAFIAIMPPSPETSKRWYSMYCRECGVEEMMADTADDPRLIERRDSHNRLNHPQGEPSDAQVEVERRYPDNSHTASTPFHAQMKREAFIEGVAWARAAGGVR